MEGFTPDFSVDVEAVKGFCPAGETYAKHQIAAGTLPVLTCEGPCIRGDIARLAGNYITDAEPSLARCCHAESFYVPHSAMATCVKSADKVIMIDGCFLKCHGRVLRKLGRSREGRSHRRAAAVQEVHRRVLDGRCA